jgi:hypothetical protein
MSFLIDKAEFDRLPHNRRFGVLYEHANGTEEATRNNALSLQAMSVRLAELQQRLEALENERAGSGSP